MMSVPVKFVFDAFSKASGIRWMKASPRSAPTANEIKIKIYFLKISSLRESAKTPTSETKLTMMTLIKA